MFSSWEAWEELEIRALNVCLVSLPCWLQGWQELPAVQWKLLPAGLSLRAWRRPEHFAKSTFAGRFGCNSLPRSDSVLIVHKYSYHEIPTAPALFSKVVLFVLYDNSTGSSPPSLSSLALSPCASFFRSCFFCFCTFHTCGYCVPSWSFSGQMPPRLGKRRRNQQGLSEFICSFRTVRCLKTNGRMARERTGASYSGVSVNSKNTMK